MGLKSTLQCFSSWWFQPIWKICSSNWIIPPSRGKNKKFLSCHHLVFEDLKKKRVLFVHFSTKPPHLRAFKAKVALASITTPSSVSTTLWIQSRMMATLDDSPGGTTMDEKPSTNGVNKTWKFMKQPIWKIKIDLVRSIFVGRYEWEEVTLRSHHHSPNKN